MDDDDDAYAQELRERIANAPNDRCEECYQETFRFYRNCINRGGSRQACEEATRHRQRDCDIGPCQPTDG